MVVRVAHFRESWAVGVAEISVLFSQLSYESAIISEQKVKTKMGRI